jgi:hypothetical protein
MQAKKVLSDSKEKNKLERKLADFKRKNKNVVKFSIAIMKINFMVFVSVIVIMTIILKPKNTKENPQNTLEKPKIDPSF